MAAFSTAGGHRWEHNPTTGTVTRDGTWCGEIQTRLSRTIFVAVITGRVLAVTHTLAEAQDAIVNHYTGAKSR